MIIDILGFFANTVCHRMDSRSVFIYGKKLPLCARCTGIYIGVLVGFLMLCALKRLDFKKPPELKTAVLSAVFLLPLMLDGAGSYFGFFGTANIIRIITGALCGVFFPAFFVLAINYTGNFENTSKPIISFKEYIVMCLFSLSLAFVVYFGFINYYVAAVFSILGVAVFYILLFSMLLRLIFKKTGISKILAASGIIMVGYVFLFNFALGMMT
ncbi:MAG: DUF2085 domain-containing protein [Lachnospiraceae bacterium]|nr:DUF2085 domain-containing protein [Lachnospiraceae bacterium]